jgi:ATP-binding cassette subfamily B (MDR/TAP) protein 10
VTFLKLCSSHGETRTTQVADGGQLRAPLDDRYILSLILQQKKSLIIASLSLLFCVAANLASPVLSGMLFETLVNKSPFSSYKSLLTAMMGLYILEPLMSRVYIVHACMIGEKLQATLRREAFRVLLMQRIIFFDKHRPSELTNLLSKDLEALRNFFFNNCSRDRGLRALLEAVGSVCVLFALSWRLGPILAGVIIATACIAWLYRRQSKTVEKLSADSQSRMAIAIDETVSQIRTVRVFAGESLERERFGTYVNDSYESGMGFARAKALLESLNRGAIHFSLLALYGLGGYLVNTGLMPVGTLLSAIGFTFSLVFATQGLLQTWTDARQMRSAVKRVQDVLSEIGVDPSMAQALPPGDWWTVANGQQTRSHNLFEGKDELDAVDAAEKNDLVLENVCFSYPARPDVQVLKNVDLTIPRGKVTALVGRSGGGKSTIAALLERLYAPGSGKVMLGDVKVNQYTRKQWVRAVTAVTQEPVLFNGTIYDNIAYGVQHATREQVEEAARAAYAHEFVMRLPEGYETSVGEQGSLLSGGQRQRIALARALLKDAPILILDEATSSLDSESESLVQQAIDTLVKDRTVLVIAHRLSTVQAADQIVVLDNGEIIEQGSHESLVNLNGLYSKLVSSQALNLSNQ